MPRVHVPLQKIKLLTARARVLLAMVSGRDEATNAGFYSKFTTVLTAALDNLRVDSPDNDTLDTFLAQVAQQVGRVDPDTLGPKEEHTPKALRAALDVLPQGCCCCCPGAAKTGACNGQDADDDIIGVDGPCLEPIVLAHFRNIVEEVRRHYATYCTPSAPLPLPSPRVILQTRHTIAPSTFKRVNWVGGSVEFHDTPTELVSIVNLTLNADDLDLKSLHAIPYVLFHECACHAFSGLRPAAADRPVPMFPCFDENQHEKPSPHAVGRPVTTAADPFAEGWMDYVAAELCSRVADGQGLMNDVPWLTSDHAGAGKELFWARGDIEDPDPILTNRLRGARGARRLGARTAARFLTWLRQTFTASASQDIGWETFLRISLDWNVLRDQTLRRREFPSRIADLLNSQDNKNLERYVIRVLGGSPVTCLFEG